MTTTKPTPVLSFLFASLMMVTVSGIADESLNQTVWTEILESPAVVTVHSGIAIPDTIEWRGDMGAAMKEAKTTGKPLLVTFRCLPCEQCATFDKTVLEGTPMLNPLLAKFITVRLTDASMLDQRIFPYTTHQDLDLSWWAYLLSSEGELYGVFGGKDHVSDSTRISEKALFNTLNRVLAHHENPRRAEWGIDGPKPGFSREASGPRERVGYQLLNDLRPAMAERQDCLHCHQVGDMMNLEMMKASDFTPSMITDKWPLPENVGIELDRDEGTKVTFVADKSPAARAGLQVGDVLGMANGTRLFSQADFRGVLHRSPVGAEKITLGWTRDGQVHFGDLILERSWKSGENWWRKTIYDGVYGPGMGFFPLKGPNHGKGKGLSVKPWMGKKPAAQPVYASGLRPNMEIIGINGMKDDLEIRKLIAWFRLNHKPGDEVVFTVKTKTGEEPFRYVLPAQ